MYNPDHMSFHQITKENDATQSLNASHKEFSDLLSKGFFKLIPRSIVPEVEALPPAVWVLKKNDG